MSSTAADPQPSSKITDIEVLRAVAITMVVLHHALGNLLPWLPIGGTELGGWIRGGRGVDLFFAVSGFVIARSLLPQLAAAGEDFTEFFRVTVRFWLRRAWRLLPSAWLWIAIPIALSIGFNESGAFRTVEGNAKAGLAAVAYVANVHEKGLRELENGDGLASALFPYWSLSLEEQFYFVLPFLVLLSKRRLPWVLAALIALQFMVDRKALGINYFRTDALFIGVLIAMWQRHQTHELARPRFLENAAARVAFLWGTVGLLLLLGAPHATLSQSLRLSLVAVVSGVLVLAASYDSRYLVRSSWIEPAFTWLGSRSYGLYLIHVPAFFLAREVAHRVDPSVELRALSDLQVGLFFAGGIVLALVLADLNYRFVERPLRERGRRIASAFGREKPGDGASSSAASTG